MNTKPAPKSIRTIQINQVDFEKIRELLASSEELQSTENLPQDYYEIICNCVDELDAIVNLVFASNTQDYLNNLIINTRDRVERAQASLK
jgi:hypothetical protein